jgi:hypothetical protein
VLLLQLRPSLNTQVATGSHHKLLHDAVPLSNFLPQHGDLTLQLLILFHEFLFMLARTLEPPQQKRGIRSERPLF